MIIGVTKKDGEEGEDKMEFVTVLLCLAIGMIICGAIGMIGVCWWESIDDNDSPVALAVVSVFIWIIMSYAVYLGW